jgi:cyclophilin family peptidyl-prolyl cis-trans isomerase
MIQGGGFTQAMERKPIGEYRENTYEKTGHLNLRGTIVMVRTGHSSSSQFFINMVDNPHLDTFAGGNTVFGKVVKGMDVVDKISRVSTTTKKAYQNVPVDPIVINAAKLISVSHLPFSMNTNKPFENAIEYCKSKYPIKLRNDCLSMRDRLQELECRKDYNVRYLGCLRYNGKKFKPSHRTKKEIGYLERLIRRNNAAYEKEKHGPRKSNSEAIKQLHNYKPRTKCSSCD